MSPDPRPSCSPDPEDTSIVTVDLARFWRAWDAAASDGVVEALERGYLRPASIGLQAFLNKRIERAAQLAETVVAHRDYYASLQPLTERIEVRAHELVHFQQRLVHRELAGEHDGAEESLLTRTFIDGSANFIAELISGHHTNGHIHSWARQREPDLWRQFRQQMYGTDFTAWLYNRRHATDQPGDLGYFIGYRIAQARYGRVGDGRQAVREILEWEDAEELLAESGYGADW